MPADQSDHHGGSRPRWRLPAGLALTLLGVGVVAHQAADASAWRAALLAAALFAVVAFLLLHRLPAHGTGRRFGAANALTTLRAAMACVLFGLVAGGPSHGWVPFALAAGAMVLDGFDGWLARLQGTQSAYGARFDLEVDALLILVLSILVWRGDGAGSWVLLIGALRYGFLLAGWLQPWLAAALPPRFWRQTICVIQQGSLAFATAPILVPVVQRPFGEAMLFVALVCLVGSFTADVAWLWRNRAGARRERTT